LVPSNCTVKLLPDVMTSAVVSRVPTGKAPHWIAVNSDGSRAYVTNESDNSVSVVDLAQRRVVATIAVGNGPRKIAVQPSSAALAGTASVASVQAVAHFAFATAPPANPRLARLPASR